MEDESKQEAMSLRKERLRLEEYNRVEESARRACAIKDYDTAATVFIQFCGREILGFLLGRLTDESDASEVFSEFAEDFWKGLPSFQWRSSLRTWAYTLARNAACRFKKDPDRNPRRHLSLSQEIRFGQSVAQIREATQRYRRTETKDKIRLLREQLSFDDQTLLVLRVDRQLSWRELAIVMSGKSGEIDEAELERLSTNLRQRFKSIKERLRKLAQAEGLLDLST
jgi:RNA polymerase sigma-70 factor (ECF subfamily)